MVDFAYRIHPAIGIARVGNGEDYYIGPETPAGLPLPVDPTNPPRGGLPINPRTNDFIASKTCATATVRSSGRLARFRIFQYQDLNLDAYPTG